MLYTLSGVSRDDFSKFPMPRNTEVFAPTFTGSSVVRSADITTDPRYGRNEPYHGMPAGHLPVRSYLAVPVFGRNKEVLGGLFFGHAEAGVFDEHAERIVTSIAGHAGVALENAKLNQELMETATKFQQLANSIPQLAWMAKPDGSIFWYNERWFQYTGMPPATQLGWGWESVHDPEEIPRVKEKWKAALTSGESWEDIFPLRHDGEFRWHLSRAQPIHDTEGRITLWFGTNTDITEQRKLAEDREELLAAERAACAEAERIGRMKDEFLATLSHELRTPLNAILGWAQLLQHTDQDAGMLQEGLSVIERNAKVQNQLIGDLLDMSRIISGKVRLEVQRVDLAPVITAVVDSVRPSADAKSIGLQKVLDPLAGLYRGDPNRLQQIVWNLLSNAIKFTPKGGKVEVLLERVNSHVQITVSDTGQGIPPDLLPHVFDRFHKEMLQRHRTHGGLGLGLAIAKRWVELHGGRIEAKSPGDGMGSTFSVTLPVAVTKYFSTTDAGQSAESHSPEYSSVSLAGKTILVVDDEHDGRDLIRRLLSERNAAGHSC